MTLRAGQAARLKTALKQQREENAVKKGDYVAVTIVHRTTVSMYGRKVLKADPSDRISYHLGRVTKADRTGRAVKVQLVAHPGAPIDAHDSVTRTLAIKGRQERCLLLAQKMTEPAHNDFATGGELKVAVLSGSPEKITVTIRLDEHDADNARVSVVKVQDDSVVTFEGIHPKTEAQGRAEAMAAALGCEWKATYA